MIMLSNFQISLALQTLRERSGLSARDLSEAAGLPPDEVSRIEAGEIGLDYLTATRLVQVLRINLADIALAAHALDPAEVGRRYGQMSAAETSPPRQTPAAADACRQTGRRPEWS